MVATTAQKLTDITDQHQDALGKDMLEDQSGEVPEQKKEAWARNEWEAWLLKEAQDDAEKANQQALVDELSQLEPEQLAQILEGSTVDRLKPAAMGLLQDTEQMGEEPPQTETELDLENVDPEVLEELVNQLDDEEIEELSDELEDQQEAQTKQAALRAVQAWRKRKQAYVGVSIPLGSAPLDPEVGERQGQYLGRGLGAVGGTIGGAGAGALGTFFRKSRPLRIGATIGGAALGGATGFLGGGALGKSMGRSASERQQERYKTDVQQKLRLMQEAVDAYKARRAQELEQYVRPMSSGGYMLGSSSNPLPASEAPEGQFVTLREGPTRVKTFRDGPSVARRAMGGPGPIDPNAPQPGGDAGVLKTGSVDLKGYLEKVAIDQTEVMNAGIRGGALGGMAGAGLGAPFGLLVKKPLVGMAIPVVTGAAGAALGTGLAMKKERKKQRLVDLTNRLLQEQGILDEEGHLRKSAATYLPPDFEQRARALQSQLDENPIRGYEAPPITPEDEAGMRADPIRSGGRVMGTLMAPIGATMGYAGGEIAGEMAGKLRRSKALGGMALGALVGGYGGRALGRHFGRKDWEETSPEARQMTANVQQASELAERGLIDPRIADETERQYMEAMNADFDRQQMGLPKMASEGVDLSGYIERLATGS